MRIYKDRYYITQETPGLSGFQEWGKLEYTVMKGNRARQYNITKEFKFNGGKFRLDNGRHPDYQPITGNFYELYDWLDRNGIAHMLNPEEYI